MTEANAFNLTFRYIDNLLSIINPHFANWVLLIYPQELEIKRNNETIETVSFATLYLKFYTNGPICTKIHHKRDGFNFAIIN